MTIAGRLVKKSREAEAFSGEGARLYGGRWNHRGTAVLYISDSLSLAALEVFIYLGPSHRGMTFATFHIEIPDRVSMDSLARDKLPKNWRDEPPPDACKDIGTDWAKGGTSALLELPSVIVPVQKNYVINIAHPDYRFFQIEREDDFSFDPRMWKS